MGAWIAHQTLSSHLRQAVDIEFDGADVSFKLLERSPNNNTTAVGDWLCLFSKTEKGLHDWS
jgi:hypothetical protein